MWCDVMCIPFYYPFIDNNIILYIVVVINNQKKKPKEKKLYMWYLWVCVLNQKKILFGIFFFVEQPLHLRIIILIQFKNQYINKTFESTTTMIIAENHHHQYQYQSSNITAATRFYILCVCLYLCNCRLFNKKKQRIK